MKNTQCPYAKSVCEQILAEQMRRNQEQNIWRSQNVIIERLLSRGDELTDAYEDAYHKLNARPFALQTFLGTVIDIAAFNSPQKNAEARAERDMLTKLNEQIARKAEDLANLLKQRSELHNAGSFTSDTFCSVGGVIEAASKGNYLFQSYVKERFKALHGQFDLKYWPSLEEFVEALAADAKNASTEPIDSVTAAATKPRGESLKSFFQALYAAIEEASSKYGGHIPYGVALKDATMAMLGNCALGLEPDDMIDSGYIKTLRSRS